MVKLDLNKKIFKSNNYLALDLSSSSTGWAVYKDGSCVEHGVVKPRNKSAFFYRAVETARLVEELAKMYKVDTVIIEELKVLKNQKTLVKLGILHGFVISKLSHLKLYYVAPSVWRSYFKCNGKREEAKAKALTYCRANGFDVDNDDEAEAILIGRFYKYCPLRVDSIKELQYN